MEIGFSILGAVALLLFGLLVALTVSPQFSAKLESASWRFLRGRKKL